MTEHQQSLEKSLISLEDQAWRALANGTGAAFYERNLTPDALMAFPFGLLDREATIASLRDAQPWATYQIDDPRVILLTGDSAILTYQATAQRTGEEPYRARMTTVFVNIDGDWKTAFHQQTPQG